MKRNQHQVTKKVSRNRAAPQSKTVAASQATNKPNPAYVEMARLGESISVLTGKPYVAALRRMGTLIRQEIAKFPPPTMVTCIWFAPDGRELARVDFEPELFSLIKRTASKLGITLQQLFDNAIRHYTASRKVRRAA